MSEAKDAAPPPEACKCEKGAPKWVVTFGDMMSLLLTFFVLLLSFSTTDVIKYRKLVGSVKEAFGVAQASPTDTVPKGKRLITKQIRLPQTFAVMVSVRARASRAAKSSSELQLTNGADWIRLDLDGDALFDEGRWDLKPGADQALAEIAAILDEFDGVVTVTGHTDNRVSSGSVFDQTDYLSAYDIGMMRAIAVTSRLTATFDISPQKLVATSMGDSRPRETNELAEGRARNRRVSFELRTTNGDAVIEAGGSIIRPD